MILLSRAISPYIMLFGLYVIFHGHYSPGGGFQGGTMLAASILLTRIALDEKLQKFHFKKSMGIPLGAVGVLIFFGIGLVTMVLGGSYLDYHFLPMPWMEPAEARSMGILLIEAGVGLAVMAILVSIYDNLLEDDDV